MMKKCTAALAALALCLGLAGCGAASSSASQAQPVDYTQAIVDARSDTDNERDILAAKAGEDAGLHPQPAGDARRGGRAAGRDGVLMTLGLEPAQLDEYACSVSLMNVQAYAVGIFRPPAEGEAEAVQAALETYVSSIQQSFQNYLPDQYEIAKGAKVQTLGTGEVVLALCEDASGVLSAIEDRLAG